MHKPQRDTIELEQAEIISQQAFDGDQYILRIQAPACARLARAGQFVHLSCDPALAMRRPLSIMHTDPDNGWVDFLYKVVGQGTRLLSQRKSGETISVLGPIGQPFTPNPKRPRSLLLGGGVGMPPMLFLAEQLQQTGDFKPLVLLGSEVPFPFRTQPSQIMLPGIPEGVIGCMPLLEDWGIPSRLASLQGYPGCHEGYITDLARTWLDALSEEQCQQVEIFSCGPHPMLEAVAAMAHEYDLPCQVSLEEYMACAVGGCAGCVVQVSTDAGPAMKRVCVDGPVFDSRSVF
ncbi:Dihydroorotate dehydrogenase (NAD(+)), electron transfer subunit [hydrothermal vent metagenome]|uniref:Dihydroorotate dehydrogenase (NAD(+)), electron transfer subunit n=1 Tax=hydrothermal vent metagenome TaxID=652676 RepID=A0A3B0ZA03_9ZZZZ